VHTLIKNRLAFPPEELVRWCPVAVEWDSTDG
jgi:hypothetical protein